MSPFIQSLVIVRNECLRNEKSGEHRALLPAAVTWISLLLINTHRMESGGLSTELGAVNPLLQCCLCHQGYLYITVSQLVCAGGKPAFKPLHCRGTHNPCSHSHTHIQACFDQVWYYGEICSSLMSCLKSDCFLRAA